MSDCRRPCDWSLMASSVPSGETPWSLLQRVAKPVSIGFRLAAGGGDAVDPAAAVVDQRLAVAQPVGRLDPAWA